MTIPEIRGVLARISFPGVTFKVAKRARWTGSADLHLEADVFDTRDPSRAVTIRRTSSIHPDRVTPDLIVQITFQEIVAFLAHEAAERFKVDNTLLFDPHVCGDPDVTVSVDAQPPTRLTGIEQ